jgi:hypothetical protein
MSKHSTIIWNKGILATNSGFCVFRFFSTETLCFFAFPTSNSRGQEAQKIIAHVSHFQKKNYEEAADLKKQEE